MDRHTDFDRIFNIYSGNGSIFVSKTLDREVAPWHNLTVVATEISKLYVHYKVSLKGRKGNPILKDEILSIIIYVIYDFIPSNQMYVPLFLLTPNAIILTGFTNSLIIQYV